MKSLVKLIPGLILILMTAPGQAQVSLPTSWDCTAGTLPLYWTTNSSSYYTSSSYYHSPPNALKFDITGAYLMINMADEPDTLKYYLRGASFTGGTFLVQQSPDGISWSNLRIFNEGNIPATSLSGASPFSEHLAVSTRYVRFYYSNKVSGNVCLDDVSISKQPPGPEAEISLVINQVLLQSGQTAVTGNILTIPCLIINSGTDSTLTISGYSFTGTNASMFSASGFPASVSPSDTIPFDLIFAPSGADGTKTATLNITSNDADENPFIINLWAVKGCCATEPTSPPQNLSITDITSYHFKTEFSNGLTPSDRYLVLKKAGTITEAPVDGQTYYKGSWIGNAQVCYYGPAAGFYPSAVVAGTAYQIKVFPVNGYPGYENYLTSNPATALVTTLPNMIGNYYAVLDTSTIDFRTALHNLINPHVVMDYNDYATYLISNFIYRDTVVDGQWRKMVRCAYSNDPYVYSDPFAWTFLSREHNFCQSWMPTYNEPNFTSLPEYSDYHNLIPVNQNDVNSYRNFYPLGEVVDTTYTFRDCLMGDDSLGRRVFEPRDEIKGDAARAMFYMITCYNTISGNQWALPEIISGLTYGQDQAVLKKWHQQDPPDAYEIAKNDYIYHLQGNRNPFIDSVQWGINMDFTIYAGIESVTADKHFLVYPNPASQEIFIEYRGNETGQATVELFNHAGYKVRFMNINIQGEKTAIPLDGLADGMYIYRILMNSGESFQGKVVVLSQIIQ